MELLAGGACLQPAVALTVVLPPVGSSWVCAGLA